MRAAEIGTGADRVLIADGLLSDHDYARAFARHHGLKLETLAQVPRAACPLSDETMLTGLSCGIIPFTADGRLQLAVAPWHHSARLMVQTLQQHPSIRGSLRITTMQWLRDFIHHQAESVVGDKAALHLRNTRPHLSAGSALSRTPLALAGVALLVLIILAGAQNTLTVAVNLALALIFLGWSGLRVLGILLSAVPQQTPALDDDSSLPLYSIVVAAYQEAASIPALIAALSQLDYPKERLDIKIVVERHDLATRHALATLDLAAPFEVIVAPSLEPRTKPKALNAALPFMRGHYVVVYDAEDRPEPQQLRVALAAFQNSDDRLACVQARLTIDNTADSWLTRLFTAEYAGLFDVFLPGLAAFRLPLPLGGTSNHFRTATLRDLGAWDPFNVTEDADLGIRIARAGLYTTVIDSSTYEEAPATAKAWIHQRTRWFKGYLQTWAVHMRDPLGLWRDLGAGGFLIFQMVVGGAVLAALVHGLFIAVLCWQMIAGFIWPETGGVFAMPSLYVGTLVAGYALSALNGFIGLSRRRLLTSAGYLLLTPFYWALLSVAAWRAIGQLVVAPYHWEKTAHGLARHSRRAKFLVPRDSA